MFGTGESQKIFAAVPTDLLYSFAFSSHADLKKHRASLGYNAPMRVSFHVLGILAVRLPFWLPAALAQTGPTPEETWQLMLSAKYGQTATLSKFVVVEHSHSGETLTYAYQAGVGWWMYFDNRPHLHMARVEVVSTAQHKAEFRWISRGPEPSTVVPYELSEEQRISTLAIFDPGSKELGAVPVDTSILPNGMLTVTVHAGSEVLQYELNRTSHLPMRLTVSLPYHKLFLDSPDLPPGSMTSSVIEMRNYRTTDGGGNQPLSITLRGTSLAVHFEVKPEFGAGIFALPIGPSSQDPNSWK